MKYKLRSRRLSAMDYWTLWDISYRNYRIEVKETGYYHPWNENGKISFKRSFGITKANSSYESEETENKFERQIAIIKK